MSIPIIGQSRTAPPEAERLPRADVSLGSPADAPAAQPVRDRRAWAALAAHPAAMVRGLVVEHAARDREPASWADALVAVARLDGPPAARALELLGEIEHAGAAELLEARFRGSDTEQAAAAASALGRVDAARLLAATRERGRLDDLTYVQTVSALARAEHEPALEWLGKSMNRAGALTPERRAALYSAALLSGRTELCARVIGIALADSRAGSKEDEVPPARAALGSMAGLRPQETAAQQAEALLGSLQRAAEQLRAPGVDGAALARAVEIRNLGAALDVLAPLAAVEPAPDESRDRVSVLRRRRGLLTALLAQREAIAQLPADAGALFVASAYAAGELVAMSARHAEQSPALAPLSKILGAEPPALIALDEAALTARFAEDGERKMRQVAGALANEALWPPSLLDRWLSSLVKAGGAAVVFEAAASSQQEGFAGSALRALTHDVAAGEAAAVEALERRPLEERATRLALALTGRLGTERLVRAVARRFYDLREVARAPLADACAHTADPRLVPLLESRAFTDEPEELAWTLCALAGDAPLAGRLQEVVERYDARGGPDPLGEQEDGIRLPLRCKVCGETCAYTMVRVFVDPKSKDNAGDPAFAGDVRCKACGADDALEATSTATGLMMESMMSLLAARRAGAMPDAPPRVVPRTTKFLGREVGMAEALRRANADVAASPDSIRARLRRGRIGLALWRSTARADAEAALAIDAGSPEALLLMGATYGQEGAFEAAVTHMVRALERVRAEDAPRTYESDLKELSQEVEDALLEMEDLDVELPATVDLRAARERRVELQRLLEEQLARGEAPDGPSPVRPAILARR